MDTKKLRERCDAAMEYPVGSFGRSVTMQAEQVLALLNELEKAGDGYMELHRIATERLQKLAAERDQARAALDEANRDCVGLRAELDQLRKHVAHNDAEYVTMQATLRAEFAACQRMRPVYEAAVEWSESFGELSKRLPPHVHKLRAAVDAAQEGK